MQTIYATHLPLRTPARESVDKARAAVETWVSRRFGVSIDGERGRLDSQGVSLDWSKLQSDDDEVFSLRAQQPDSLDKAWAYRTNVDIGLESSEAWIRVRLQLQSAVEGLLIRHQGEVGRPGIVRDVIEALDVTVDDQQLSQYHHVRGREEGAAFARFLLGKSRRLPVIAVSRDQTGQYLVPPGILRDRLLGLAHVFVLDSSATFGITDEVGQPMSVFGGAIRLYWPWFTAEDDPYRHRLYLPATLERLGADTVVQELFERLGQLAGFSLDEPLLRRRLVAERRRIEAEASAAQRAAVALRLQPEKTETAAISDDYAELFAGYEEAIDRIKVLDEEALDREAEYEREADERKNAEEQLRDVVQEWQKDRAGRQHAGPDQFLVPAEFTTIVEAVEASVDLSPNLLVLDEAFQSAAKSGYPHPQRVYEDLALAAEVADLWATDGLNAGPTNEFKQRTNAFRDGIGVLAEGRYRKDYEREYQGSIVLLQPHMAHGIGAVSNIMRIYMYFDTVNRVIVVGHVGRKLRDSGNRN